MTFDLANYIVESGAWAVAGFVGGFVLGRVVRDAYRATPVTEQEAEPTVSKHDSGRTWRPTGQFVTGIVVILLAVATVVQGLVESAATRAVVDCQQQYSNAFADALDARTTASGTAQNALDQLVSEVGRSLTEPPTAQRSADVQKAITTYLSTRAALKKQQQEHPYPPAPRDLCQ